ncbi:type II toxin-antitoxin system VapC family toxin [Sorangium sp. So ce296]|uniref:Twitching motility protein PilT n=1 Tax=Sorangium cellulosum TaxID=56 RepID=A0A150TN27_SORCE|nr:twitching motility protein PilT [Sorangium cellulosum]
MRLLLDTHCWLWLVADPERIRRDVVEMLVAEGADVYISAATAWEIVIKHALGKLSLPIPPAEYIPSRMAALGHLSLPIEQRHTLQVAGLPPHHKDPFDRILVAQAQVEDIQLVTADRLMAPYDVRVIWADA